jgi:hypothetical protein
MISSTTPKSMKKIIFMIASLCKIKRNWTFRIVETTRIELTGGSLAVPSGSDSWLGLLLNYCKILFQSKWKFFLWPISLKLRTTHLCGHIWSIPCTVPILYEELVFLEVLLARTGPKFVLGKSKIQKWMKDFID